MKTFLKAAVCLALSLVFLSPAFAGGQQDSGGEAASASSGFNATGFPIMDEKITLRVFAGQPAYIENFGTNEFVKMYEEMTNVHIEWEAVPSASLIEKKNLVFASGDFPDIFLSGQEI